jgi:F420-dependent hydroxymycolic acid dehydrogenase
MEQTQPLMEDISSSPAVDHRNILKTAGTLVAASALGKPLGVYGGHAAPQTGRQGTQTGGRRKRMMGFMLAHEQFRVRELVEIGAHAEQAGFDLLATSDHLQPWQANEGTRARPGSPWPRLVSAHSASGWALR